MAADSGVLLGIILVRSSFAIRCFPRVLVEHALRHTKVAPRFAEYSRRRNTLAKYWLEESPQPPRGSE
jgi:hypothetical protein